MTINRRRFLQQLIQSASLISINSHINISAANTIPADSLTALPRFLDTLLPEDVSPSATQLGIDKDLLQHAQTVDNYPQLLQIGCQWLDQHAMSLYGKSFALLNEEQTTQTVINLEKTAKGSNPQLFFERIKSDAFIFYYANPASWYGLGLSSPPQPVGYPNHDQPPVPNH